MTDSKKVSELPIASNVASTDRVLVLRDPAGSPSSRTITVNNFALGLATVFPIANGSSAGVIKVGNNLTVNSTGYVSSYYPAYANDSVAGIIKVGDNLTVNATGYLSAETGGGVSAKTIDTVFGSVIYAPSGNELWIGGTTVETMAVGTKFYFTGNPTEWTVDTVGTVYSFVTVTVAGDGWGSDPVTNPYPNNTGFVYSMVTSSVDTITSTPGITLSVGGTTLTIGKDATLPDNGIVKVNGQNCNPSASEPDIFNLETTDEFFAVNQNGSSQQAQVMLPESPPLGKIFTIIFFGKANPANCIVVPPAGKTINGSSDPIAIDKNYGYVSLIWDSGWSDFRIVSADISDVSFSYNIIYPANGDNIIINGSDKSNTQTAWTFGSNGVLTLPTGGEINTDSVIGDVIIEASDGTSRDWIFANTGNLTIPGNIFGQQGNDLGIVVYNLNSEGGTSFVVQNRQVDLDNNRTTQFMVSPADVQIATDFSGSKKQWTFTNIGTLNLPDYGSVPSSEDGSVGDFCRYGDVLYFKTSSGWATIGLTI